MQSIMFLFRFERNDEIPQITKKDSANMNLVAGVTVKFYQVQITLVMVIKYKLKPHGTLVEYHIRFKFIGPNRPFLHTVCAMCILVGDLCIVKTT